jgi:hypothetical protein
MLADAIDCFIFSSDPDRLRVAATRAQVDDDFAWP